MSSAEFHHPFESVDKFGGTSMAQPDVVADIVEQHLPQDSIIVVSAPGKDVAAGIDVKMTDQLIEYAKTQDDTLRDEIIDRLDTLYSMLPRSDRNKLKDAASRELAPVRHFGRAGNYGEDYYASRGELFSTVYFARAIGAQAIHPAVVFDGSGALNREATAEAIRAQVNGLKGRVVVPGYYGEDHFRRTWTLDRGGSDRTGALYAAALDRDYTNWTDVDGIFSANPSNVPDARIIRSLIREEVREGAHGGSGVLQGDAIVDLNGSEVVTTVRNTFDLDAPGTKIFASADQLNPDRPDVVSVTGRNDHIRIGIRDLGMAGKQGYFSELLGEFARLGLSLEHTPMAQDSVSITLAGERKEAINDFIAYAQEHRLSKQGEVIIEDQGVAYLVGEGLRHARTSRTVLRRALEVIDGLDIEEALPVMNEGAPSIAFVTKTEDTDRLVAALHAELIR